MQASYMGGMRTHPNDIDLINNMALSYAMAGQYDRAIELANRSGMSPLASQRHRESQAIIYILAGYQTEARQILAADYDADLVDQRVKQYSALAKVPDTGRRAAILGEPDDCLHDVDVTLWGCHGLFQACVIK